MPERRKTANFGHNTPSNEHQDSDRPSPRSPSVNITDKKYLEPAPLAVSFFSLQTVAPPPRETA
jgi:hypothetical protein